MPQAILLQDVEQLGERGTVVDVSAGYLRNYLQPRKLAEPATDSSIKVAQRRQEDAERAVRAGLTANHEIWLLGNDGGKPAPESRMVVDDQNPAGGEPG